MAGDIMLDVLLLPELQAEEQPVGIALRGGGSAANTAAWIAASGDEVTFAGCIGDDDIGVALLRELERSGVRTAIRSIPGAETGCVAVQVLPEGERVMRSARGANAELSPEDIVAAGKAVQPYAVHLTGYALLGPYGFDMLAAAAEVARSASAHLSFDVSSAGVIRHMGAERLLEEMRGQHVDLLLANAVEAGELTGKGPLHAAALLSEHFPFVVIKNGAAATAYAAGGVTGSVPPTAAASIDSTGAGDAFNAGVLVGLNRHGNLRYACMEGHVTAGEAIGHYGGRPIRPESSGSRGLAGST